VECPVRRGEGTTPPVTDKGGGVSERWGGGPPPHRKFEEAPHPPLRNYFAGPPSPRVLHKIGEVGGSVNGEGPYPSLPHIQRPGVLTQSQY